MFHLRTYDRISAKSIIGWSTSEEFNFGSSQSNMNPPSYGQKIRTSSIFPSNSSSSKNFIHNL